MDKPALPEYPISPLLTARWSPRAFDGSEIDEAALRSLLEAVRWAPSCFNEQPWRLVVALRQEAEAFATLLSCLTPTNQSWAKQASLLICTIYRTHFSHNEKPNRHGLHDIGLGMAQLTVQAAEQGLHVHHMAGFDAEKARTALQVPEGHELATFVAVGKMGDPSALPESLAEKERAPRTRKPQQDWVFSERFGKAR